MKMTKKVLLAALLVPMAVGSASVFASGGKGYKSDDECGPGAERGMMKQLNLTDAQRDKMRDMRQSGRDEWRQDRDARRGEMQAYHAQMQALVLADNFDKAAAEKLARQMVDQQVAHRVSMMEKRHQMMSVLTPEQKAKFSELQNQKMNECMKKGPGPMRDNMPPKSE